MRSLALLTMFLVYLPPVFLQPFCGILLWTWFSIMNPHRLVWGFGANLPYALIIALTTLLSWLLSREPKTPPRSWITVGLIGLMITTSIATFLALSPAAAFEKWDAVIKTLFMSILTLALLTNRIRIHAFIWALVISLGYFGVKGAAFSIVTGGSFLVFGPESTMIYDNNHLAVALIMAVPLMYYLQLHSKYLWVRLGLFIMLGMTMIAAVMSYSRGGLLAMIVMGIIIWWRSPKKLGLSLLIVIVAGGIALMAPEKWFDRMNTIATYEEDNSAMSRIEIWKAGLAIVAKNPFFGGGYRVTYSQPILDEYAPGTEFRAIHNSHLEVLVENGVIAFFFHLLLIGGTWFYASRVRRLTYGRPDVAWARDLASMLQTSLAVYVSGGMFLSLGYYDGWYSIAIAAGALHALVVRQLAHETTVAPNRTPAISSRPSAAYGQ